MQRPKRACTERAKQKIQEILAWEACTESSQLFKDTTRNLQAELCGERKPKDYAPSSTSESDNEEEEAVSAVETDASFETDASASDSQDETEKKTAFEAQAADTLVRTCSHSPNS
jgi:hypothetical protein